MNKKICTVIHRRDLNNVGDISANPLQYFLKNDEYNLVDIDAIYSKEIDWSRPVIIGGGGLIANQFFGDVLRDLTESPDKLAILEIGNRYWQHSSTANASVRDEFFMKLNHLIHEYVSKLEQNRSPRIIWGAGHNGEYQKKIKGHLDYPNYFRLFDMIGIRDYAQPYEWVPCASCMHPAFQKKYPVKNKAIWFEHKKQLLKTSDFGSYPIPRFVNSGNNMDQTIEILGSADIILTNSYHGAYWGTLLKRKVIVVEPWSSKFNAMKYKPYFLNKGEYWEDIIHSVPSYENALDDCIDTTKTYWNKVKSLL